VNQSTDQTLSGIVERVTYHNEQNGWSVLKVKSFRDPSKLTTVLVHQVKVFAGATMEFRGQWVNHPKHGEQFKASFCLEKKPASAAAIEKYLGSGLIKGVGPATAKRIVTYFKANTLEVFENNIEQLMQVPGIAEIKLKQIKTSWLEHAAIRQVMLFLQGYGISTLFAAKIYKTYGDKAIEIVTENPYRLAHDIYGIGFFSADKIALAMGFQKDGQKRIEAAIRHVLSASRDEGHCYLTREQIQNEILNLLREPINETVIDTILVDLDISNQIKSRWLISELNRESDLQSEFKSISEPRSKSIAEYQPESKLDSKSEAQLAAIEPKQIKCYYSKSLYFDELVTANQVKKRLEIKINSDPERISNWITKYSEKNNISLSEEQFLAVRAIVGQSFSVLTGGPGCGKTTCTKVLVQLLKAMGKNVLLAAPTGRAAQRMTEVIGLEAKTIHRLLEWEPSKNGFKRDKSFPLFVDFLIIDEASMLDVSLTARLFEATPIESQIVLIGDPDQLPSVGAGNVLSDLLSSKKIPRHRLTKIFRQAEASSIIKFAHQINSGIVPAIYSPIAKPQAFSEGHDCLFFDTDEATQDQMKFIKTAKWIVSQSAQQADKHSPDIDGLSQKNKNKIPNETEINDPVTLESCFRPQNVDREALRLDGWTIPEKFKHVDLNKLNNANTPTEELKSVLKKVHPWSSINYGYSAMDTLLRIYTKTVPQWLGGPQEIQILTPQIRGTMGSLNLNESLQRVFNPESPLKSQIQYGSKIIRVGDRVIQTRNNYDLGVFNGDIGHVTHVDNHDMICQVQFSGHEARHVEYQNDNLNDLSLAYAITIHKSQGSEFPVVIIPVFSQHYNMLFRNLIYTALTRAKKLAIFVGNRKAFSYAVSQVDNRQRQTQLTELIDGEV